MQTNTFLQGIKLREPQVGLWVSLCSNFAADVVATAGYDWALLDMEHSPNEIGIVMSQMQALQAGNTSPVTRPMWNDPVLVKRLIRRAFEVLVARNEAINLDVLKTTLKTCTKRPVS